jgi:LEA14-like dessication related protein
MKQPAGKLFASKLFVNKLLICLLIFVTAITFTTCKTLSSIFQEPRVTIHSVEIAAITFTGVQLLCKVNVENPNGIEIPFPEIDWEFFLSSSSFVKGTIKNDRSLRARRTTAVDVPVSFNYADAFSAIASLIGKNQTDYKVALAAKFNLPVLGEKVWNLSHEGNIPLLKVPSIGFKGITLKNLSLSRIDFELAWEIDNSNIFAMGIKDFSYNFTINSSQWAGGNVTGAPRIAANGKTTIPITFSVNSLTMIRDITEIVNRGTNVTYGCSGNLSLGADMRGIPDYTMPFNLSGSTRIAR